MDTNRIKRFATEARNILKTGIGAKIKTLGFDRKGNVAEEHRPQLMQGGTLWNEKLYTEGFYHQWMSLYNRIQQKGMNEVYEEAAYTWFNRLCAIRILQKNHLCAPILDYADAARTPLIVDEARQGRIPQMKEDARTRLMELLDDDAKVTEQFALLITAWCHDNPILNRCFGSMADYTELLLPNDILAEGKFMDMLNHTEFITDEEFQSPELIGWLYQFYISERKDEVFAKKGKFEADDIPAATQIFTPNWIVKYMVQNTVGRIYLNNNPYETEVAQDWKYLVNFSEPTTDDHILRYDDLTDLRLADLACGSGHILGEMFDMLYTLYINEGYSRREAIEHIFRRNLTGIDIDTRAKQLAQFALLLKACQRDASFADCHCMPRVLDMPQPYPDKEHLTRALADYIMTDNGEAIAELADAVCLMDEADNLGSIMKFGLSERTRNILAVRTEEYEQQTMPGESVSGLLPYMRIILALTEQYHALVMNPPYMGGGNMNTVLSNYVKKNYETGKADLMTVFMMKAMDAILPNGYWAMINLPSWLFLPSFEQLRYKIITSQCICCLNYNGRGVFGSDFGSVSFVVKNDSFIVDGIYRKLFKIQGSVRSLEEIQRNFEDKTFGYYTFKQDEFLKVPGYALAFWLPMKILDSFDCRISNIAVAKKGLSTGDNNRFLRLWQEVSKEVSIYDAEDFNNENAWYPINKGGIYRKWYGNNEYVIYWKNNGELIKKFSGSVIRNPQYYLQESLTWTMLSASCFGIRYSKPGKLFEGAGPSLFAKSDYMFYLLGFLCSKIGNMIIRALNPTVNININDVLNLPFKCNSSEIIDVLVSQNISISKSDWDAHETSWDFQENELVRLNKEQGEGSHRLSDLMDAYREHWTEQFLQLHANEEELNRQFIEIYGLEDELTPDVPLSEVTILQQGEVKVTNEYLLTTEDGSIITDETGAGLTVSGKYYLDWQDDVIAKQLISYAVGCMLGRYRLDKPGLHIAHPEPTAEEIAPYTYKGMEFAIDDDGIMPLMNGDCGFSDNAPLRMADFVRIAFGEDTQVENLNYIEKCLGKTLEQYFVKDFWKDHKKMYQNRPIYWLFASKKGAFQVIAYMHRMNAYTVERIRAKYLLPYIEHLEGEINKLDMRRTELNTKENKQLQKLQKQLDECREYHERLQVVAEQAISFDLDDGVVVNYAKFGDILAKRK